jgi:hypothetical protein
MHYGHDAKNKTVNKAANVIKRFEVLRKELITQLYLVLKQVLIRDCDNGIDQRQ